jgi:cyclase
VTAVLGPPRVEDLGGSTATPTTPPGTAGSPGPRSSPSPELIGPTVAYLRFVQDVARRGVEAGLGPLDAARETDLGEYAGWSETERIVGNLHRAYAEVQGGPVDVPAAFRDMVAYNGGRPLTCRA